MATANDLDIRGWFEHPSSPIRDGNNPNSARPSGTVSFFGYPYVSLSSITINSIVTADTSTEAPMALFASASDVSAVGTRTKSSNAVNPYQDLEYRWELTHSNGDPVEDLEGIIDPRDGSSVNPYTDQVSPEFTCIIREAGDYTLTLTARGMSSTFGTVIEQTATKAITVTASSLTKSWYDIASGNDANDGLDPHGFALTTATYTESTRELTQSGAFSSYTHDVSVPYTFRDNWIYITKAGFEGLYEIESKTSNDTIVLKTGLGSDQTNVTSSDGAKQNFDGSDATSGTESMLKFGTYDITSSIATNFKSNPMAVTGYGGKPKITSTTGVDLATTYTSGSGSNPEFLRLSNINFDAEGNGNTVGGAGSSSTDTGTFTLVLDNCDSVNSSAANGFEYQASLPKWHFLIYDSYIDNRYGTTGKASSRMGVFTDVRNGAWARVFSATIDNDADDDTLDHFWYPSGEPFHTHFAYSQTRNGSNNNYAINLNNSVSAFIAEYICVNNSLFGNNSNWALDASNGSNEADDKYFENYVATNNKSNVKNAFTFNYALYDSMFSYNQQYGAVPGQAYRGAFSFVNGSNYDANNVETVIFANQVYGQGLLDSQFGFTTELVDNETWQTTDSDLITYSSSLTGAREFVAEGNNLYAPSVTGGLLVVDGATGETLSTFNADTGGDNTSTLPSWADPANGDFGGIPTGIEVTIQ